MYQPKGVPSANLVHNNGVAHNQQLDTGAASMDQISGGNNNPSLASKQRLRWTHELHDRFVDAVAQLGGPDREFLYFCCLSFCGVTSTLPLCRSQFLRATY